MSKTLLKVGCKMPADITLPGLSYYDTSILVKSLCDLPSSEWNSNLFGDVVIEHGLSKTLIVFSKIRAITGELQCVHISTVDSPAGYADVDFMLESLDKELQEVICLHISEFMEFKLCP